MRFSRKIILIFLLPLLAGALFGCGEKSVTVSSSSRAEASAACLGCHENTRSSVTAKQIAEEWKLSSHYSKNGAGCTDCHEPDAGHPSSCGLCHGGKPGGSSSSSVTHNPDEAGKCAKCHTAKAGFGLSTHNGVVRNTLASHFNNTSSSYVSTKNVGKCRNCHNPHDTGSQIEILRAWARSKHGETGAPAWNALDFKSRVGECNRCHTTTGFIKYITTGDSKEWGAESDKTKEMLECRACHTDFAYNLRQTGQVTAKYTGGSVTYPDVGDSNLCLNCHVGRESGTTVKNVQRNYTSAAFVNSHYLTAGGIVFGEIGYEYEGRNYDDPNDPTSTYRHRYIGTGDARGNSAAGSTKGPCVGCHLANKKQMGEKHTFKPYIVSGTALSPTCETSGCHGATATRAARDRTFLEVTWKPQYQAALSALKHFLATNQYRKMFFYAGNPYFFRDTNGDGAITANEAVSANAQKKWYSTGGSNTDIVATGKNNMGAAFNYNLLIHDKGGVAHNRFYTRRLIYDAIDWLDDNKMNNSVAASLNVLSGTGTTSFKAEAITYLINAGTSNVNVGTPVERF